MNIEAMVENAAMEKKTRNISVNRTERACINCVWYEQYFRQNRGNIYGWTGTNKGFCLNKDMEKGALSKPCASFSKRK